jgi:hypothetical protein
VGWSRRVCEWKNHQSWEIGGELGETVITGGDEDF